MMSLELIYGAILTLTSGFFWHWVKSIEQITSENRKKIAELQAQLYKEYPNKGDLHHSLSLILDGVKEVKNQMDRLDERLDKKVDKT